jgi:antitoxin CcdA
MVMGPENKQDAPFPLPEAAGVEGCQTKSAELWKSQNRQAITAYNVQVDEEGVFSDGLRTF